MPGAGIPSSRSLALGQLQKLRIELRVWGSGFGGGSHNMALYSNLVCSYGFLRNSPCMAVIH